MTESGEQQHSSSVDDVQAVQQTTAEAEYNYRTRLRQFMTAYFNADELRTLCVDLEVPYEDLPQGLTNMARELIAYLDRRGRIQDLVVQCTKLRPQVPWAVKPAITSVAPGSEYSRPVSHSLNALVELMQSPEVRAAVIAFRTSFKAASEQVNRLDAYKRLHDLLHNLQLQCYLPLESEYRRSANGDLATEVLMGYEFTLQGIVRDLKEVAAQTPLAKTERSGIQDIERAHEALTDATAKSDLVQLKKAVDLLKRVVNVVPSLINTRLYESAQNLRLPDLIEAMEQVNNHVAHSKLEADKISLFEAGVDALANLNHRLTALTNEHDQWQALELDLRRIEANIEQDYAELVQSWPDVKAMAEALCSSNTDDCMTRFIKNGTDLETAIASGILTQIKGGFKRFSRQASMCFYQVDVNLKKLCEDLRKIGEPLASVMRVIE